MAAQLLHFPRVRAKRRRIKPQDITTGDIVSFPDARGEENAASRRYLLNRVAYIVPTLEDPKYDEHFDLVIDFIGELLATYGSLRKGVKV